jgi:thiamine phosphate synthase YjbQ (UPF0047 family)
MTEARVAAVVATCLHVALAAVCESRAEPSPRRTEVSFLMAYRPDHPEEPSTRQLLKFAEEHGEDARGCHNTDAHLISSIIGRSVTVVIADGEADLGEFGYIYFIDFDTTRARNRTVDIAVTGD